MTWGVWTEDRVDQLKTLWAEGLSCSQIARALGGGATRNSVIGKIHRMGQAGRVEPSRPATIKTTSRERVIRTRRNAEIILSTSVVVEPPMRDAAGNLYTLLAATFGQCRFLYLEGEAEHCCAHPVVVGTSWCKAHFALCFTIGAAAEKRARAEVARFERAAQAVAA